MGKLISTYAWQGKAAKIDFQLLIDLYSFGDYRFSEVIKTICRTIEENTIPVNAVPRLPEGNVVIKTKQELESWLRTHFPKRLYYQFTDVDRNGLNLS